MSSNSLAWPSENVYRCRGESELILMFFDLKKKILRPGVEKTFQLWVVHFVWYISKS